jgi:cell division topological specificity factor
MSFFDRIFGKKESAASVARDRLLVTLSKERASTAFPYMDDLRRDIIEVLKKYTDVKEVNITSEKNQNIDTIAIDIELGK